MSQNDSRMTSGSRVHMARSFVDSLSNQSTGTSVYAFLSKASEWTLPVAIDSVSQSDPVVIQSEAHGLENGDVIVIEGVTGMTELNALGPVVVNSATTDSFSLVGINSTGYTAYSGGGKAIKSIEENWPPVTDDIMTEGAAWREMISMKALDATNAELVVPRQNWKSGTVYRSQDSQGSPDADCVVVENRVYKCVWNGAGAVSTVTPTGTALTTLTTTDGYIWKYVYELTEADLARHAHGFWIPVRTLYADDGSDQWAVQEAAVPGTIDAIVIERPGQNYDSQTLAVTVVGDGTGATATVSGNGVNGSGGVVKVNVTSPGRDYTWADVVIEDPAGTGFRGRAVTSRALGHGTDLVSELGAHNVMVTADFIGDESGKAAVDLPFRRFGIVANPVDASTRETALGLNYDMRRTIQFDSPTGTFKTGYRIEGQTSGATALVASVGQSDMRVLEVDGEFEVDEVIASPNGVAQATVTAFSDLPVVRHTGRVVYLENRGRVSRMTTQTDRLRAVVAF